MHSMHNINDVGLTERILFFFLFLLWCLQTVELFIVHRRTNDHESKFWDDRRWYFFFYKQLLMMIRNLSHGNGKIVSLTKVHKELRNPFDWMMIFEKKPKVQHKSTSENVFHAKWKKRQDLALIRDHPSNIVPRGFCQNLQHFIAKICH